jgi:hypothetical protein
MSENDFYVGYLPKSPDAQARFTRRIVISISVLMLLIVVALTFGQEKLPRVNFEFDHIQKFQGTIEASPYPTLVVSGLGAALIGEDYFRYLLVAPGKHGADDLVRGLAGKKVSLDAKLIYREGQNMLEVIPGSVKNAGAAFAPATLDVNLGAVSLVGEIVDSKCYTGVMNPGNGKVHRDCAARCISGGIPPLLLAKNNKGDSELYQLISGDGRPLSKEVLRMVAQPVTIEGKAFRRGSALLLYADKITPVSEATIRGWSGPRRRSD